MLLDFYERDSTKISDDKFKLMNRVANDYQIHTVKRVGPLMDMIRTHNFSKKEEWEKWYFSSDGIPNQFKSIAEELHLILSMEVPQYEYSIDECKYILYYITVCETWNGYLTECNFKETMHNAKPQYDFRFSSKETDWNYGVDIEAFKDDTLKFAIQVKPETYKKFVQNHKDVTNKSNKKKQELYVNNFAVPVYTFLTNQTGTQYELFDTTK